MWVQEVSMMWFSIFRIPYDIDGKGANLFILKISACDGMRSWYIQRFIRTIMSNLGDH